MIRLIEELSMNAWPAVDTQLYDGWVMRFSSGYTRRANSVSPIYESTILLDEKISYCEKAYGDKKLPTIFKITDDGNLKEMDKRLDERGYIKNSETSLRILDLRNYISHAPEVIVETEFSEEWLKEFFRSSNIVDKQVQLIANKILGKILGPVICVSKQVDDKLVGFGYGAIERDYIGLFDVVVDKEYRGKGFGKDIINGILAAAVQKDVKTAYLQVSAGNEPAEKLYEKVGFIEAYRYWYRTLELK